MACSLTARSVGEGIETVAIPGFCTKEYIIDNNMFDYFNWEIVGQIQGEPIFFTNPYAGNIAEDFAKCNRISV